MPRTWCETGYGAAKAAVLHINGLLTTELGPHNIRVNVIVPAGS